MIAMNFKNLLSPLKIKDYFLKNRIVFAPMSTHMASPDGSISEQMLAYYADKAFSGAAMVITETFHVDNKASRFTFVQPSLYHDRFIPRISNLADEIKRSGSIAIAQIGHAGRQTIYEVNNCQPVAPSKIPDGPTKDCYELTEEDIEVIIQSFADAAYRAEIAGFDGVEIHGGNGYLINEFLSPFTNKRTDEYGKNKALFLIKVINTVSNRIHQNLILGVRLGVCDFVDGGLEPKDAIKACLSLPKGKIDYIHTSAGTNDSDDYRIQPIYQDHALLKNISKELKSISQIPIILTGSINNPGLAEKLLADKAADLIGMGRPLLADPTLPKKIAGLINDEVCPCIRCNQGCLNRVRLGKTIKCSVNPHTGYESSEVHFVNKVSTRKSLTVLIAGAGPAGITAALRAKELGFKVKLFEKDEILGGLLNTAKYENFKKDIQDYLNYLINRVLNSGIEIIKSTRVDFPLLKDINPHIFINATGSIPIMPTIPERFPYQVFDVRTILFNLEEYIKEQKVIIIGGDSAGCELGYTLSLNRKDVTIIEQASDILLDIDPVSSLSLKRLLDKTEIIIHRNTRFIGFNREGIITDKKDLSISGDLIVIAMGSQPNSDFDLILKESKWKVGTNYLCTGDAKRIGKIYEAVNDTYWSISNLLANY